MTKFYEIFFLNYDLFHEKTTGQTYTTIEFLLFIPFSYDNTENRKMSNVCQYLNDELGFPFFLPD